MELVTAKNNTVNFGKFVFETFILEEEIKQIVQRLAFEINTDYEGKNPVFVIVLSGAFIFAADLLRSIDTNSDITVVKVKSYEGLKSSGKINIVLPLDIDVKDRHVVIIEDIVDTARTLEAFTKYLKDFNPRSIELVSLLSKPEAHLHSINIKYLGKNIPNDFVIGYGLDYDGAGRNLRHIYKKI